MINKSGKRDISYSQYKMLIICWDYQQKKLFKRLLYGFKSLIILSNYNYSFRNRIQIFTHICSWIKLTINWIQILRINMFSLFKIINRIPVSYPFSLLNKQYRAATIYSQCSNQYVQISIDNFSIKRKGFQLII